MEEYEQLSLFDDVYTEYQITKPVRLISFFSGIEAQYKALAFLGKKLGIQVSSYKTCEWAYNSIIGCNAIHNRDFTDYSVGLTKEEMLARINGISVDYNKPLTEEQLSKKPLKWIKNAYNNCIANHNLLNIMNVKGSDLEIVDTDKYEYIVTYSFPCITKDSLILTSQGYVPFEQIKVGDKVLTKSNTWQKVSKIFDNGIYQTGFLNAMGLENIHCTPNHKFYVREMYRQGHFQKRCFKEPQFKEAKDLTIKDYLGIPVIQDEVPFYTNDLDFWFMLGMYVGDGWLPQTKKQKNEIIIACNEKKLDILKGKLPINKYKYTYSWNSTCYRFRFANKEIRNFVEKYIGTGCENKKIPLEILNLPKKQLLAFYEGYLNSDGCIINNKHQFTSINRKLIYDLSLIINKLFHRPTCIYKVKVNPKKNIQGRLVNQNDWFQLRFKLNRSKQDKAFYENGYIWYPFKSYKLDREEHIYNMEVENDHSYILQGCISKNCQDLSLAGKRAGMDTSQAEGGTRSGLLWEVERILGECKELGSMPNVLIMENVPAIHSEKDYPNFEKWMLRLEELGYCNFYTDLNAKDFGIPQNRERCFMVSILGSDINYKFPRPIPRLYNLKDFLEDKVDERYYLSEAMINYLTGINQKKSKYDRGSRFESSLRLTNESGVAGCITTAAGQRVTDNFILEKEKEDNNSILIKENTEEGYRVAHEGDGINISSRMHHQRGNVQYGMAQTLKTTCEVGVCEFTETEASLFTPEGDVYRYIGSDIVDKFEDGDMATTTFPNGYGHGPRTHKDLSITLNTIDKPVVKNNCRIRKLTPKEAMRLMAFQDIDVQHMYECGLTDSAIFHCAGDSIVVCVLIGIMGKLFGLSQQEIKDIINEYIETIRSGTDTKGEKK